MIGQELAPAICQLAGQGQLGVGKGRWGNGFILEHPPNEAGFGLVHRYCLLRRSQDRDGYRGETARVSGNIANAIPYLNRVGMVAGRKWTRAREGEVGCVTYFGARSECDQLAINGQLGTCGVHNR